MSKYKCIDYKYELLEESSSQTFVIGFYVDEPDLRLRTDGTLTLLPGYKWDGATGAIDTKKGARGSAVHDALYRLMRSSLLPSTQRKNADITMRKIWIEDGLSRFRAWYRYGFVRMIGWKAAKPREKPLVKVYRFV